MITFILTGLWLALALTDYETCAQITKHSMRQSALSRYGLQVLSFALLVTAVLFVFDLDVKLVLEIASNLLLALAWDRDWNRKEDEMK